MADTIPLKAIYNTDNLGNVTTVKSLAEFTVSDVIGVPDGGTGVAQLGSIISDNDNVTIEGGASSVISTVKIGVNLQGLTVSTDQLSGIIDGGTFT